MQMVFREIRRRGVAVDRLDALEVFGWTGESHTIDYFAKVRSLQVWELDQRFEPSLRRNLPGATVKVTDSYEEIRRTSDRFGLIVADNPLRVFGEHCEHFDLFPLLFRIIADEGIVVVNAVPRIVPHDARRIPTLFDEAQLRARGEFYRTDHPENVPMSDMMPRYQRLIEDQGFEMAWWFSRRRRRSPNNYLVMLVRRR
jgi:hypothetical protein